MNLRYLVVVLLVLIYSWCDVRLSLTENFKENPSLGRDLSVVVIVKDFKQNDRTAVQVGMYKKKLKREKMMKKKGIKSFKIDEKKSPPIRARTNTRELETGMIFGIDLNQDFLLLEDAKWKHTSIYPSGMDFFENRMVVSNGNSFEEIDFEKKTSRIVSDDWFRHLHTLQYNEDGTKILVVSSGFDTVLEYDLVENRTVWEWCGYDHGYNHSSKSKMMKLTRDPEIEKELREKMEFQKKQIEKGIEIDEEEKIEMVVLVTPDDPYFGWMGLPLPERSCHINSAFYLDDENIGMTFAQKRTAVSVSIRTGEVEVVLGEETMQKFMHSFAQQKNEFPCPGFMISNTENGSVIFTNEKAEVCLQVSLTGLPSAWCEMSYPEEISKYHHIKGDVLETVMDPSFEWIQTFVHLKDNIYSAVDCKRRHLLIIDIFKREYRAIPFPVYLSVHEIRLEPPHLSEHFLDYFERRKRYIPPPEKQQQEGKVVDVTSALEVTDIHDNEASKSRSKIVKGQANRQKEARRLNGLKNRLVLSHKEFDNFREMCYNEIPLDRFMTEEDSNCVMERKRLCVGDPLQYHVFEELVLKTLKRKELEEMKKQGLKLGDEVKLVVVRETNGDKKFFVVGSMRVESIFNHDRHRHSFLMFDGKSRNVLDEEHKKEERDGSNDVSAEWSYDRRVREVFMMEEKVIGGEIISCLLAEKKK